MPVRNPSSSGRLELLHQPDSLVPTCPRHPLGPGPGLNESCIRARLELRDGVAVLAGELCRYCGPALRGCLGAHARHVRLEPLRHVQRWTSPTVAASLFAALRSASPWALGLRSPSAISS
jgi:hypothetical protein